jgi:hypothetical protein
VTSKKKLPAFKKISQTAKITTPEEVFFSLTVTTQKRHTSSQPDTSTPAGTREQNVASATGDVPDAKDSSRRTEGFMYTDATGFGRRFCERFKAALGAAVLIALLTSGTIGQQKTLQHLPISNYMSEVGLLYIEEAQNYYDACRHAGTYEAAEKR